MEVPCIGKVPNVGGKEAGYWGAKVPMGACVRPPEPKPGIERGAVAAVATSVLGDAEADARIWGTTPRRGGIASTRGVAMLGEA